MNFLYFRQITAGIGLGVVHVSLVGKNHFMSYVPVDLVNNAIIAAAYHTNERWNNGQTEINIMAVVDNRNSLTIGKYSILLYIL